MLSPLAEAAADRWLFAQYRTEYADLQGHQGEARRPNHCAAAAPLSTTDALTTSVRTCKEVDYALRASPNRTKYQILVSSARQHCTHLSHSGLCRARGERYRARQCRSSSARRSRVLQRARWSVCAVPRHAYKGVALLFLNRSLLFQWGSVPYSPPHTVLVAYAEESPNNSPIVYTVWFWSAWGYGTKSSHLCELAGPTAAIQGTCGMPVSGTRSWRTVSTVALHYMVRYARE